MVAAYIGYRSGKPYDVALDIEEKLEGMVRFVASTLEYSLTDVYKLNIIEFFRDWKRAQKVMERRKAAAEKYR